MAQSNWHIKLTITSLVTVALIVIPGMYAPGINSELYVYGSIGSSLTLQESNYSARKLSHSGLD